MEKISELSDYIGDEIADARKYLEAANKYKTSDPELAQLYYHLSEEETKHMQMLHEWALKKLQESQRHFKES